MFWTRCIFTYLLIFITEKIITIIRRKTFRREAYCHFWAECCPQTSNEPDMGLLCLLWSHLTPCGKTKSLEIVNTFRGTDPGIPRQHNTWPSRHFSVPLELTRWIKDEWFDQILTGDVLLLYRQIQTLLDTIFYCHNYQHLWPYLYEVTYLPLYYNHHFW